jgi:hypothetical protein
MGRGNAGYETLLFRGWEWVKIHYEIDGSHVVVREQHTWTGTTEKRVPIADLDRRTRRVWSRQPANWVALLVMLLVGVALGLDLMMREGGLDGGQVDWRLWGPGIAVGTVAWFVLWGTRGRREWTQFPGRDGRTGLYVLRGRRDPAGQQGFLDALRKRLR